MAIHTISMMEFAKKVYFGNRVLVLDEAGAAAYGYIMSQVKDLPANTAIEVDFKDIICDIDFLLASIFKVSVELRYLKQHHVLFLSNYSEVRIKINYMLLALNYPNDANEILLGYKGYGNFELIGEEMIGQPQLKMAFGLVRKQTVQTARQLADLKGISVAHASQLLKKLYDKRVIMRFEETEGNIKQNWYFLPKKTD